MSRSLNKVELIGNLTRDPELRYTPAGTAVCTFGLATNRQWTTESGEKKEDVEFHRIVAWNKLAELCSQLLAKGRKVYIEGRLQTRKWTGQDNVERQTTEVVINDMIILDSRGATSGGEDFDVPDDLADASVEMATAQPVQPASQTTKTDVSKKSKTVKPASEKKVEPSVDTDEDIPF
jgi:single stranded DNA-binding protein (ssb)